MIMMWRWQSKLNDFKLQFKKLDTSAGMNYCSSQPDYGEKHIPPCDPRYITKLDCGERSSTITTGNAIEIFVQNTETEHKRRTLYYYYSTVFFKRLSYSCFMYTSWGECRFFLRPTLKQWHLEMKRVFHIHSKNFSLFYFKRERKIKFYEINSEFISMRLVQWTASIWYFKYEVRWTDMVLVDVCRWKWEMFCVSKQIISNLRQMNKSP